MNRKYFLLSVGIISLVCICCANWLPSKEKTYIAFQSNEGGKWGLIGLDGEVLFENMFDSIPSYSNGMFFVQNGNGLYTLYKAARDPFVVGDNYTESGIGVFNENGIAAVSRKGKSIEVIDKEGSVKFLLDTINGMKVTSISPFDNKGLAIFNVGDLKGCIDDEGNVIVEPEYSILAVWQKNIVGVNYRCYDAYKEKATERIKWDVLDLKGQKIGEINNVYQLWGTSNPNCFIASTYARKKNNQANFIAYGIVDLDGNYIHKPILEDIGSYPPNGKWFCYSNGKNWGVMDLEGKSVIQPKYDMLRFLSDNIICVENDGEGKNQRLIDIKDESVGNLRYYDVSEFENGTAIAEIDENRWVVIDEGGSIRKELPEVYRVARWKTNKTYSNDVDIDGYIEALRITKNSIDGVSFEQEWEPITEYAIKENNDIFGDVVMTASLDWGASAEVGYAKYCNDIVTLFVAKFPSLGFFTEEFGGGKPQRPKVISAVTMNRNQMEGNLDKLFVSYLNKIRRYGHYVDSNENALLVESGGVCYTVWRTKDRVGITMGKVEPELLGISQFETIE